MTTPNIDWAGLRTAVGSAAGIPDAIQNLFSPDRITREAAYWKIDNYAVLQSDLYEVAPFVVEGLLARLTSGAVPNPEVYNLLVEFALGSAPGDVFVVMRGMRRPLEAATKLELAKGEHLYVRDLIHAEPEVRRLAAQLLHSLAEVLALEPALRCEIDRELGDRQGTNGGQTRDP